MPFARTNSAPTRALILSLAIMSAFIVAIGILSGYSFLPDRGLDGFLYQIEYARDLIVTGGWGVLAEDPLAAVHILRYVIVWPFLQAESVFGSAGSLTLLLLLLWPLLISFRPQRGDWRDHAYVGVRFAILILPLLVSGRTVLVAAGMGYLISGIMMRPFSGWRMFIGCLAAILSSASVLFTISVLLMAGNWRDRSRAFYAAKGFFLVLVIGLFVPSLIAKVDGFATGAVGYAIQEEGEGHSVLQDDIGVGPVAAIQRIVVRSTLVQSYREGNEARMLLYVAMFLAAWVYVLWSAAVKHWHPMLVVLVALSGGILLEGLALWPILFPLVWAYTGIVRTSRNRASTESRIS